MSSKKTDTRIRILASTLELLEAGGGKSVRMSDVAKAAGVSRQAVYLHFGTRAELLIATTHYLDELKDSEQRLVPSRTAKTGVERLDAWVVGWANYVPEIYGLAKAFWAMLDTDEVAAAVWKQRMADMREGCAAAIEALHRDGRLSPEFELEEATDLLWTMISVRNWEQLTQECGWSQEHYVEMQRRMTRQLFVAEPTANAVAQLPLDGGR